MHINRKTHEQNIILEVLDIKSVKTIIIKDDEKEQIAELRGGSRNFGKGGR